MGWMAFYNHRRLHYSSGYLSPMQFEQRWYEAQRKKSRVNRRLRATQSEGKVSLQLELLRVLRTRLLCCHLLPHVGIFNKAKNSIFQG